jgi:hypothetical protein
MSEHVISYAGRNVCADAQLGDLATGHSLRLFQNDFTPTFLSQLADFVECTFDGYAAKAISDCDEAYSPGYLDRLNIPVLSDTEFIAGGGLVAPQTAFGYYLTDSGTATGWIAAKKFDTPLQFSAPLIGWTIDQPILRMGAAFQT